MHDYCCQDCLMLLANGEFPPEYSEEQCEAYAQKIERRTEGFYVVPNIDNSWKFSTAMCDVCGSQLAGYRCEVIFTEIG